MPSNIEQLQPIAHKIYMYIDNEKKSHPKRVHQTIIRRNQTSFAYYVRKLTLSEHA